MAPFGLLVLAMATSTCRPEPRRPATAAAAASSAPQPSASVPPPPPPEAKAPVDTTPPLPPEPARLFPLETACDGKDDDGDGHTDRLIPSGANACLTPAKGACAHGWSSCLNGESVCDAPPPTPEVVDGIDNDCNGMVDDVSPARVSPRALILGPRYIWTDAKSEVASVATLLDQAGVPYDTQPPATDWSTLASTFERYSLLVVPGYVESSTVKDAMLEAMESFAKGGGVVFVMKPMANGTLTNALELAGIKSSQVSAATSFRVFKTEAMALESVNSPEEANIPLSDDPKRPMSVWTFGVDGTTQVLAEAYAGQLPVGALATRRPLGRGAVYAWGHDLATFDVSRCYVNCFEPSGDLLRLFMRDALREGAQGHVVLKHPIPGFQPSALLLTHDVAGSDAYREGAWGDAGALQMAAMEKKNGVRATYNFTTDYIAGYFKPEVVEKLCADGFGPAGAHSVQRPRNFGRLPRGTCKEARETYGAKAPATLCGEVRVSLDILGKLGNERPRAWRSPYLSNNAALFDVLAENGVTIDSGFGIGDLKYNLPVDTAVTPKLQRHFHHRALFEFPITGSDGTNLANGERTELQTSNLAWFGTAWEYMMLRNAENGSITTMLVHPTRGDGVGEDNIRVKVGALEHLIQVAQAHGIAVDSLVHFGDFWRARSKVTFDASYDAITGYTGWIQVGDEAVEDLTFELGDTIKSFDCADCGRIEVRGKRVVLRDRIAAGTRASFAAKPREVVVDKSPKPAAPEPTEPIP